MSTFPFLPPHNYFVEFSIIYAREKYCGKKPIFGVQHLRVGVFHRAQQRRSIGGDIGISHARFPAFFENAFELVGVLRAVVVSYYGRSAHREPEIAPDENKRNVHYYAERDHAVVAVAERPKFGLVITLCAGATNMLGDFLLIYVAKTGVTGAAIATVVGECVGGVVPLVYFLAA